MAINKYPYTDFNEYNMDWIIKTVKDLSVKWAETHTEWEDVETEWESYKNYITNYFQNLDVQSEVNTKINELISQGYFNTLVYEIFAETAETIAANVTSAWIDDNLLQETGYVIDTSLSVGNAAADAEAVGQKVSEIYNQLGIEEINFFDQDNKINAYINGSSTIVSNASNRLAWAKLMPNSYYRLMITKKANTDMQIMMCDTVPDAGVVGINKYDISAAADSVDYIFETGSDYLYIAFKYWATSATTYTEQEVLDSTSITLRKDSYEKNEIISGEYAQDIWVYGGINSSTGVNTYSSTGTYITPLYIDDQIISVTPNSGYYVAIFAYDKGTYVGCLGGSQVVEDGTFSTIYAIKKVKVHFEKLRAAYPTYKYKLLIGKLDATDVAIKENIILEYSEIVTEEILKENEAIAALNQAKTVRRNNGTALTLLHFSDIHGDASRLADIVNFRNKFSPYINDTIFTGDMVAGAYPDGITFWTSNPGAADILTCIGNHDAVTAQIGGTLINMDVLCSTFISPFISNWGTVSHNADTTYYYKDYTTQNVRLIVLDCMHEDATQLSWLASSLSSASSSGLHVIIATHFGTYPMNLINCDFSPVLTPTLTGSGISDNVLSAVNTFQTGGGTFVCYLTGHEHQDMIQTPENYPDQLVLNITCATNKNAQFYGSDQCRYNQFSNAMNLVTINATDKIVSIKRIGADMDITLRDRKTFSYDYENHRLLK